jgi:hypothetical protein
MAMPDETRPGTAAMCSAFQIDKKGGKVLVAETSADSHANAANGTAAVENGGASLGFHACTEPVCFHAVTAVGLKCALGHESALLFPVENLRF